MSPKDDIDMGGLKKALGVSLRNDEELFKMVVNEPFQLFNVEMAFLFLGIIVLLLVNKKTGMIDRVALSNTDLAKNTTDVSYVPFEEIKIPRSHDKNIIAKAIKQGKFQETTDWKDLFTPALTAKQARVNQASAGIAFSAVYPLKARGGGAMIFSYYQYASEVGDGQYEFMKEYAELVNKRLTQQP